MRVAVIGAGPAGLTAALTLQQGGAHVDLFEASEHVGGLSRSIRLWDQTVDLGPHRFFSQDARVNRFWLDIVGSDYEMVDRLTRIHYDGKLLNYPLHARDVVRKLGPVESARCIASCVRERILPTANKEDHSFESWIVHRFGRRLFETFFRSYSEKLWGIPCTSISDDFAAQRIRSLTLWEAIKSAMTASLPTSLSQPSAHRTLVDQFAYPIQGTGEVYRRIADQFQKLGGELHVQSRIDAIDCQNDQVTGLRTADGQVHRHEHIISTMPLTKLVDSIHHDGSPNCPANVKQAAGQLRFRNTILVYLQVDDARVFDDQWRYIHCPDVRIGRVSNFRNWASQLHGDQTSTVLCAELWCDVDDTIWSEDDQALINQTKAELTKVNILKNHAILDGRVTRVPRCYPIYEVGYRDHVRVIADHLTTLRGLHVIGRYGAFKYNNQDHSILTGLLAADNILSGAKHDLWAINSDFDSYQERAMITATGLSPANTVVNEEAANLARRSNLETANCSL